MSKPNQLINEKSPYLLQHAYNPIDWYPRESKAFEKAKRENKPIFRVNQFITLYVRTTTDKLARFI